MAYIPSNDYLTKSKSLGIIWKSYIKVLPDNITISSDDYLQSWSLKNDVYDEKTGKLIGNAVSRMLDLQFINTNIYNVENKEIELYLGVVTNPQEDETDWVVEYVPYGKFIVQPVENHELPSQTKFTAYDYMIKLNGLFDGTGLTAPITLQQLFVHIATKNGLGIGTGSFYNGNFVIDSIDGFSQFTYRELLSSIAKLSGTVATINRTNQLSLNSFGNSLIETIDKNNYFTFEKSNKYGPLNELVLNSYDIDGENVTIQDEQGIIDNGLMSLNVQEKIFTNTQDLRTLAITDLWTALHNLEYVPLQTKASTYNWLDPLDKIIVKGLDDTSYSTYVFNQLSTYNGGFKNEIKAFALTQSQVENKYIPKEEITLQRAEISVNKANAEIELKVSKDEVVSSINLSPEMIKINSEKIALEGYTTINNTFGVDLDGNVLIGDTTNPVFYNLCPNSSALYGLAETQSYSMAYDGTTGIRAKTGDLSYYYAFESGGFWEIINHTSTTSNQYLSLKTFDVDSSKTYKVSLVAELNKYGQFVPNLGTFVYYDIEVNIDEYDDTNTLISYQNMFVGTDLTFADYTKLSYDYTPTNANVKKSCIYIKIFLGGMPLFPVSEEIKLQIGDILVDDFSSIRDWTPKVGERLQGSLQITPTSLKIFDEDKTTLLFKLSKSGIKTSLDINAGNTNSFHNLYGKLMVESGIDIPNGYLDVSGNIEGTNISVVDTTTTDKVRITGTNDVTLTSTNHPLQIGPTSGLNIAIDGNEIMARNNGVVSELHLNNEGGPVFVNNKEIRVTADIAVAYVNTTPFTMTWGTGWTKQRVPFNAANILGTRLTLDATNKGIKIGAGVSNVRITGNFNFFNNSGTAGDMAIYIHKNGVDQANISYFTGTTAVTHMPMGCSEIYLNVAQNDLITMEVISGTASTKNVFGYLTTTLTVEVIE